MNKQSLVQAVATELKCSKSHADSAVNAVVGNIKKGLKKDKTVQLIGFGTFAVKMRKARKGRNPQTGAVINIKASKTAGFKPSKEFKSSL